jgi:hypothetical protein
MIQELKARAYDLIAQKEAIERELMKVNEQIREEYLKQQEPKPETNEEVK